MRISIFRSKMSPALWLPRSTSNNGEVTRGGGTRAIILVQQCALRATLCFALGSASCKGAGASQQLLCEERCTGDETGRGQHGKGPEARPVWCPSRWQSNAGSVFRLDVQAAWSHATEAKIRQKASMRVPYECLSGTSPMDTGHRMVT